MNERETKHEAIKGILVEFLDVVYTSIIVRMEGGTVGKGIEIFPDKILTAIEQIEKDFENAI